MPMITNKGTEMDRNQTIKARLQDQGAELGTIDAFAASVRELEAQTIARALRAVAGDTRSDIGDIDPAIVERIAYQIATSR